MKTKTTYTIEEYHRKSNCFPAGWYERWVNYDSKEEALDWGKRAKKGLQIDRSIRITKVVRTVVIKKV